MNKKLKKDILTGLSVLLLLSGCGKESDCEIPSRHVHKYLKQINNEIVIEEYIDSEKLTVHGFNWTNDYIEINKNDEEMYKLLNNKMLFDGNVNWDYLFNKMKNNHDYLMFYYEYYTTEIYTTTDSKGNTEVHTREVRHDGWHDDPNDYDNTGDVRLYHHRYYGYRIVNSNGKLKLERSNLVDDIRDILDEYSYYDTDATEEVYKSYKFKKRELKNLNPDDFDVFNQPNLEENKLILTR